MADLKFLEDITLAKGISGQEKEATRVMKKYVEDYADEIVYDNLGSLVAIKKGTSDLKVLITGHIDEIGFIVKEIDKDGYVKVHPVGGWMGQNLPSSLMNITTRTGKEIKAVFGSVPPHGQTAEARNKVVAPGDSYLDIGVTSREAAEELGIKIGDPITPASEFIKMANPKFLMSKAWDDRVGAAIAVDVLRNLKDVETEASVYAAGTVQEEVGLRGAKTVAQMVQPDVALAVDVCFSHDLPGGRAADVKLGCGAVLGVMDGSVIAHTGLLKEMENICADLSINYQLDILAGGGTDSGEMHKVGAGVINMTLSVPSRYMHSHHTIIHEDDYDATVKLITEFVKRLNKAKIEEIKLDKQ